LRQGDPATATIHDDDPVHAARRWVEQGAEWLHLVNLDGALASRSGMDDRDGGDGESPRRVA